MYPERLAAEQKGERKLTGGGKKAIHKAVQRGPLLIGRRMIERSLRATKSMLFEKGSTIYSASNLRRPGTPIRGEKKGLQKATEGDQGQPTTRVSLSCSWRKSLKCNTGWAQKRPLE